jgi:predicted regulator of Ras-like GTPase activity (Roadblock/LC7/MglB family)
MFQSILSRLKTRAGARWAMIVANDGVLLETDTPAFHAAAESLAAEYASLFRSSRKAASNTEMGGVHSSLLVTDQGKLLFQTLTPDYFLVLSLETAATAGKALYEVARATGSLEEELVY